ncbi:hypothetical protein MBLNU230_g0583t1 [Neophaeotheca triangularis]
MKFINQAASAVLLAGSANAFWRMPCRSRTGLGRLDPIVDKGTISGHVHAIHGGGNFGFETTFDDLTADGSCTSCSVSQDHSAYWTPALYFMYDNGTTVMVPQIGGMLAYYLYYLDNVKSFPEGFEVLAGTPRLRNFEGPFPDEELSHWPQQPDNQTWLEQRALGFNCLDYSKTPEASLYRHTMPDKEYLDNNCPDGIRLELGFPSCGTGEKSSPDHKSHVAYPNLVKEGNCPDTHPVHYPFLFYETIWATNAFAGEEGQFTLSNGDPTGCGYHGDFIMGWESSDFLQTALDTCTNPSGKIDDCPVFDIISDEECAQCSFDMPKELEDEQCQGPRDGLPVNVPVQGWGPDATPYPIAGRKGVKTSSMPQTTEASSTQAAPSLSYSSAEAEDTEAATTEAATGDVNIGVADVSNDQNAPNAYSDDSADDSTDDNNDDYSEPSAAPVDDYKPAPEAAPEPTEAPAYHEPANDDSEPGVSTKWITQGNEVIEMVVQQVQVTVTETTHPEATDSYNRRRHLHNHMHQHIR